ncbi:hypothetical protein CEXT_769501 [Caerostris extrusa]|uniref:Uncharacterized protein n=1 Tax=Caerostris extrusa TaxID=172846 RepID=A0AAV4QV83_CAEEX|nr:hypothetical protein CEXT_769501 [Caerostris extrusa]
MPVCSTTKPSRAVSEIARWFALPRAPTAQNEITLLEKVVGGGGGVCVHEVIMHPEYYTRKGIKFCQSVVEHLYIRKLVSATKNRCLKLLGRATW